MSVAKRYKILISKQLANGVIASMEFATEMEEDTKDEKALFEKVYKSVRRDVKYVSKVDECAKLLWDEYQDGIKKEKESKSIEEEFLSED